MQGVVNIDDLRKLAKRRLPKIAYDFIEGGTDDEVGLNTNEQAFRQARLVPRYLVDVTVRDQSTTLFGRTYSSPLGIAPTGLAGLFRRGADLMLAEAARDANVPFIMSGSSTGSIEDLGKLAPDHGWYQLYSAKDQSISEDMIRRAGDAGLSTLVFTVDVPELQPRAQPAQRLRPAAQAQPGDQARGAAASGLDAGVSAQRHAVLRQLGAVCAGRRTPTGRRFRRRADRAPMTWKHVERFPQPVAGQPRAQGHHAPRRCHPRPRSASTASWCATTAPASSTMRRRR